MTPGPAPSPAGGPPRGPGRGLSIWWQRCFLYFFLSSHLIFLYLSCFSLVDFFFSIFVSANLLLSPYFVFAGWFLFSVLGRFLSLVVGCFLIAMAMLVVEEEYVEEEEDMVEEEDDQPAKIINHNTIVNITFNWLLYQTSSLQQNFADN